MVRVRRTGTGDLATIGVCPACWNLPERRADLLVQLGKMGLEVAHRKPWRIAIEDPAKHGEYPDVIQLNDGAVATSGTLIFSQGATISRPARWRRPWRSQRRCRFCRVPR